MADRIKELRIKGFQGAKGDNGTHAFIGFDPENLGPNGKDTFWVAVPNNALPHLAAMVIQQMPQPEADLEAQFVPFALDAKEVGFGTNPEGRHVITLSLDEKATMVFELDAGQVAALAEAMAEELGNVGLTAPKGTKLN